MTKKIDYLEGLDLENIESLKEKGYYRFASVLFEKEINEPFDNGEYAHALWGMYKLFEMAEHSINVFSGKLKEQINGVDFYANTTFLEIVKKFLKKPDSNLSIVTEEMLENTHPFMDLQKSFPNQVEILTLQENYSFNHFMVADSKAYRYELDEDDGKVKAKFNFNDEKSSKTLIRIFDILKTDSK